MKEMFAFEDWEDSRWQWDINQRLQLKGVQAGTEVHFASDNDCSPNAERMVAYEESGNIFVDVPNKFFCLPGIVNVYLYLRDGEAGYTQTRWSFRVKHREKPSDYIYTETEVLNYTNLDERVKELEQNGVSEEGIAKAVEDYMSDHPVEVEVDETLTQSGQAADAKVVGDAMEKLKEDLGGVSDEQVIEAVNKYLSEHGGASPTKLATVELKAAAWSGTNNLYSQVVAVDGVTERSQVVLAPSVEQLAIFYDKSIAFVTENESGVVTVYAIGQKPENDYTMQATITEVNV